MENNQKLDPEFKKKWLEALRSGEYQQCKSVLYDGDNGFCCLGVAGVIIGIEKQSMLNKTMIGDDKDYHLKSDVYPDLLKWRETESCVAGVLAKMNDGDDYGTEPVYPKSFSEIADYIEANL